MVNRWIPPRSYTLFSSWRTEEFWFLKNHGDESYAHLELDGLGYPAAFVECGSTATGGFADDVAAGHDNVGSGGNA
jgi:hypothetical protein